LYFYQIHSIFNIIIKIIFLKNQATIKKNDDIGRVSGVLSKNKRSNP
jgi:hypothetical protein